MHATNETAPIHSRTLTQKIWLTIGAICCFAAGPLPAAQLPPECPRQGALQIVEDPAAWADRCFAAINGRTPNPEHAGESHSEMRDIDLDGVKERLEVRGVGNSVKQIYVFRVTERGHSYLGELNAHPSFTVAFDSAGVPTISYLIRAGADSATLKRIQYRNGNYVEISSEAAR